MLNWLYDSSVPVSNPEADTRNFITTFDRTYEVTHPRFEGGSYQTAVSEAHRQSKLLLVYLHSPIHQDTDMFCRNVMCSEAFTEFVDSNFLTWGGSIHNVEAYSLCTQLGVTTFPAVAVFQCQSQRSVKVVDKISGYTEPALIMQKLQAMATIQNTIASRTRAADMHRQEEMSLRAQQDAEYQEAIEMDRQTRLREEEEHRAREAAEAEEQLQAAMELSKQLDAESVLIRLKAGLSPEPAAGADVATIRFQLPSSASSGGAKISRRFHKKDTVQVIYDYLSVHFYDEKIPIKNFIVCTNFPKKDITDKSLSVDEVGLFPRGALFVTDLDA
jgi:FAS-associated factor 2